MPRHTSPRFGVLTIVVQSGRHGDGTDYGWRLRRARYGTWRRGWQWNIGTAHGYDPHGWGTGAALPGEAPEL